MEIVALDRRLNAYVALRLMQKAGARCALVISPDGGQRPSGVTTPRWLLEALLTTDLGEAGRLRVGDVQVPWDVALTRGTEEDPVLSNLDQLSGKEVPLLDLVGDLTGTIRL